ncbi:MAG: hypothetical protein IPL58_03725 [Betaproteobacteria bacterium]|uniref:SAF domain-containing protein n=1 Tax=Candidatus Proximibacter danicus TaxID=2954365 RepID=A0A9D7K0V2_9PROT|nr:hypothetical protein [Candidatus Proximibacter danicus]
MNADMLIAQRPGTGCPPSEMNQIVGRIAHRAIAAGELVLHEMLLDSVAGSR